MRPGMTGRNCPISYRATAAVRRTAYRSKKNEAQLAKRGFVSLTFTQRSRKGRDMAEGARIANAGRSKIRSSIEHALARIKRRRFMGLTLHTVGIARATAKIEMADLTYNFQRLIWLNTQNASK